MIEVGKVVGVEKRFATVRIEKKDECSKCGMCLFPKNANHIDVTVENDVGVKQGDTVKIKRQERGKLLSITLVFLLPLLFTVISAIVAYFTQINEIWILILSLISDVIWYFILALLEKKFKKLALFRSEIIEIVNDEN